MMKFNVPSKVNNELLYLENVLNSQHVSGSGTFTKKCHDSLKQITKAQKVLVTHSCTAALEMCYILLGIGRGDEVIMPSFTFTSSANAVLLRGATPVFVDVDPENLNIDPQNLKQAINSRTKAISVMHYAGIACDMDAICSVAKQYTLPIIEDAAQCIDAYFQDKHLGTFGDFGAISFHDTKNIHCGQGGALLINDKKYNDLADICWEKGTNRKAFLQGKADKYTWQSTGSSFLLSELNAALLLAQLEEVENISKRRLAIWQNYFDSLKPLEEDKLLKLPQITSEKRHNGHIAYLILENQTKRDELISFLNKKGVPATFHYIPLHLSPAGKINCRIAGDLLNTERVSGCLIRLPLHDELSKNDQNYVIESIKTFFALNK